MHNRIAVFRTEKGWSRKELAEKVGVNYQTIGFIERGDYSPSLELALKMAELFDVPVDALFSLRPFIPLAQQVRSEAKSS